MGLPRTAAQLGIVNYAGAYYHPKTYHFRRGDGTQAAYVGSANLTGAGIQSLHVEAGVLLDTQRGDPPEVLNAIASSVDEWFTSTRAGLETITGPADVDRLTEARLLSVTRAPRVRPIEGAGGGAEPRAPRPRLQPLIRFPGLDGVPGIIVVPQPVPATPVVLPAVPREPFPPYVLLAPGAETPTSGIEAVSGSTLPGGYSGLIIQLSRDSTRHWRGEGGTANISIPVPTVTALRFGIYQGQRPRPRAEYNLDMRYLCDGIALRTRTAGTNVMVYGFPGDPGHSDVRMVVPAGQARELRDLVQQRGKPPPARGDVALLEWPTVLRPTFRLSLIESGSPLFQQSAAILAAAAPAGEVIGRGACWLPPDLSPAWD